MHHLILPLDRDHDAAVRALAGEVARVVGTTVDLSPERPHVTLLAFSGIEEPAVRAVVEATAASTAPFMLRAHGYGAWATSGACGPSLHIPIVRDSAIDALHRRLCRSMSHAGADLAGWTMPEVWSPHITIAASVLDPSELGKAIAHLLERHHPSWHIPIDRVQIVGGRADGMERVEVVALGEETAVR